MVPTVLEWVILHHRRKDSHGETETRRSGDQGIRGSGYREIRRAEGNGEAERKEVLKLRSWEDGKRGEKFQMTNDKCQLNFDISDKKDEVFWTGATFICFILEDSQ